MAARFPILPEYVESVTDDEIVLRNYAGEVFRYPLPRETVGAGVNGCGHSGNGNGNGNGKRNGKGKRPEELVFLDL